MFLLTTAAASPFALSRWADFFANFGEFAKGFLYTLGMSFCALLLAFVLGAIFGAMSSSKSKVLKAIARVYV
ncbi:MAG: amino acid ABC transporter permease, partial [Streptococcus lutetiensis]|nr:amino acid ABC transporter permease [Streptococcus lutetiensis]